MFLSTISTTNLHLSHVKQSLNLCKIIKNLKKKNLFLSNNVTQYNFNKQNFSPIKQNLVSYVIKVNLSKTNTIVTITDILGSKKKTFSSGFVGLTKTQKKKQPMALLKIFKFLLFKSKLLQKKTVILEFNNTKPYIENLLLKLLNPILFIDSIKRYSLRSHNGCRPKKIKRFKRRTKRLVLNN